MKYRWIHPAESKRN